MTAEQRLERDLPDILGGLAAGPYPDYIDDVLSTTAARRQRPSWAFPERWLPVELVTARVPATRLPIRQVGVLALIAILLAAMLAVYIGSRQQRSPAPFGPATNGQIAYDSAGDIYVVDPETGVTTSIVASPADEIGPRFSRDGTRIVFARNDGEVTRLFVAGIDGAAVTEITKEPIKLTKSLLGEPWQQYQFSPDGRSVLIATGDGVPGIALARTDGSGIDRFDVGMAVYEPSFRPPDGREILFVGGTGVQGIFAVDVVSREVRTIVEPSTVYGVAGAEWSPDGSKLAYWRWGGVDYTSGVNARTRIVGADGTGDRELPMPLGADWGVGSEWSNDGTRLVIAYGFSNDVDDVQARIVPADGSGLGREVKVDGAVLTGCCPTWEWAPDDRKILLTPTDGAPLPQMLVDVASGDVQAASWDANSDPTWQRLAP